MNLNLYYKELKRNRKNLTIWTLIAVGFTFMILAIFPYMKDMGTDLTNLMDKMPAELKKAMGMDTNTWANVLGFYSTYYGIYIILLVGIFTTSTGATIISKEEKDKTAEFLLTQPLSRQSIFMSKMAALFTLTVIIFSIQTLSAIVGLLIFNVGDINWTNFNTMHIHGFVLILFFTSIGVILSMYFKPKKNFMGMVVGLIFGSYFLDAISKAADAVEWIGYISPFHYLTFAVFDPDYSINFLSIFILLIIGLSIVLFANLIYSKKDITT